MAKHPAVATKLIVAEYTRPGAGVNKPISTIPLYSPFSVIVKRNISSWIWRLYLAGVAAAQLQWHLPNMNVIQGI